MNSGEIDISLLRNTRTFRPGSAIKAVCVVSFITRVFGENGTHLGWNVPRGSFTFRKMVLRAICFLKPGLHSGLGRSISFSSITRPLLIFECSRILNSAWNFASLILCNGNFNCLLDDFSVKTSLGTDLGMPAFLGTSFRGVDLGTIWSYSSEFVSKL